MADQKDRNYLHAQVNTVVDHLLELIELARTHPADAENINRIIEDLKNNAKGLTDELAGIRKINRLDGGHPVLELADLAPALATINPTRGNDAPDLDEFLLKIGSALIDAQARLNQRSKQYSEAAAVEFKGLVPAAQFRIPSVKAEMTIGINEVRDRTVNLIFIKDSETKENFVESKISFELVAAPPPPGAVVTLTPFLLLEGRPEFLAELERLPAVASALGIANTKRFGVVFAVPKDSAAQDTDVFLVVYLVQDQGKPMLDPMWKTIVLVAAQKVAGKLQLYDRLLEASDTNPLVFPKTKSEKVTSFGDALMQVVAGVYQWMISLGLPPEVS